MGMGMDEDKSTPKPSQRDEAVGKGKLPGHCAGHQAEGLVEESLSTADEQTKKCSQPVLETQGQVWFVVWG